MGGSPGFRNKHTLGASSVCSVSRGIGNVGPCRSKLKHACPEFASALLVHPVYCVVQIVGAGIETGHFPVQMVLILTRRLPVSSLRSQRLPRGFLVGRLAGKPLSRRCGQRPAAPCSALRPGSFQLTISWRSHPAVVRQQNRRMRIAQAALLSPSLLSARMICSSVISPPGRKGPVRTIPP